MDLKPRPTLLTSRGINGIPSSTLDNVAWNNDGQCLFVTRRNVTIMTPYLTSTLPPPPILVDSSSSFEYIATTVNKAKRQASLAPDEDVNMDDPDEPGPSTRAKFRRPVGGDVRWWTNGIELDKENARQQMYGWSEVGDEYSSTLADKDITIKGAAWSPSGMNDLGGSLLTVIASSGQVSVYAPKSDPASKPWVEISDLTMRTRNLLDRSHTDDVLSIRGALEMRTTCLKWSDRLPSLAVSNDSGALLALANRSGLVALWRYGAKRHFERAAYVQVTKGWVSHITWSAWKPNGDNHYESELAVACTDGAVSVLKVQQRLTVSVLAATWETVTSDVQVVDVGDKRNVTAIKWINGLLVWAKHGSVHFYNGGQADGYAWRGLRSVRLERVGSWASANALGSCIEIQPFGPDRLRVTLSSFTHHIITSLSTGPTLAPLADSLRLSVITRDCFLDFVYGETYHKDRFRMKARAEDEMSANGGGWAALDGEGQINTWVAEPVPWHNLDGSTEGTRVVVFTLMDFAGTLGQGSGVGQELEALLRDPPNLLNASPIRVLLPFFMRVFGSPDPQSYGADLLQLCGAAEEVSTSNGAPTSDSSKDFATAIWSDGILNRLRLRQVIALWATTTFPALGKEFVTCSRTLTQRIRLVIAEAVLHWTAARIERLRAFSGADSAIDWSARDGEFLRVLRAGGGNQTDLEILALALGTAGEQSEGDGGEEKCPACKAAISTSGVGSARCKKGHEWSRCSVTDLLVTNSTYRVCDTCPAISLFPHKCLSPPMSVQGGEDVDGARSVDRNGQGVDLVDELLCLASICVMCGGRWTRSM